MKDTYVISNEGHTMTRQTITARKDRQTKTFEFNYATGMATVRDSMGRRTETLDEAMLELRTLPESGWTCR